jgi:carbon storage regulator
MKVSSTMTDHLMLDQRSTVGSRASVSDVCDARLSSLLAANSFSGILSEWLFFPTRGSAMQIISRRENESIVIDNRIIVTVLEFEDDFVRLAIETPHEDPSYREEVIHLVAEFA